MTAGKGRLAHNTSTPSKLPMVTTKSDDHFARGLPSLLRVVFLVYVIMCISSSVMLVY